MRTREQGKETHAFELPFLETAFGSPFSLKQNILYNQLLLPVGYISYHGVYWFEPMVTGDSQDVRKRSAQFQFSHTHDSRLTSPASFFGSKRKDEFTK